MTTWTSLCIPVVTVKLQHLLLVINYDNSKIYAKNIMYHCKLYRWTFSSMRCGKIGIQIVYWKKANFLKSASFGNLYTCQASVVRQLCIITKLFYTYLGDTFHCLSHGILWPQCLKHFNNNCEYKKVKQN